jgi:hypothetical protein
MWERLRRLLPKSKSKEELEEHYRRLENVELEKNDLMAMMIAALVTIVLPILLLIAAIYGLVYFLFVR